MIAEKENQEGRSASDRDLVLPERVIPVPASISEPAKAILRAMSSHPPYPAVEDLEGWESYSTAMDAFLLPRLREATSSLTVDVNEDVINGIRHYDIVPEGVDPDDRQIILDFHGGGLIMGGGECCRHFAIQTAVKLKSHVVSVDYRMPPHHRYPAALDDCVAAYRHLLADRASTQIVIFGGSAGSNLVAATVLRARDEGLPLPGGAVLMTPELDLTESGDSFHANLGMDTILTGSLMPVNLLYADGQDLAHPYLSPLFGDFEKGFPPTFIGSGTRDLFLSNAVRMHNALLAADIEAQLHLVEAGPHGGFPGAPEGAALYRELLRFLDKMRKRSK